MSKTNTDKIKQEARKLCRHTIVFTDVESATVASLAMRGISTRAIADELGLSAAQAQYRVSKAQNSLKTRFRADYRNGRGAVVRQMLKATDHIASKVVRDQVAPQFIPFARAGVPRVI